jgi:ankyrin repeat protein
VCERLRVSAEPCLVWFGSFILKAHISDYLTKHCQSGESHVSDTTLFAITIKIMSDSKELSVLRATSQRLIGSHDGTTEKFCHRAADVSAFEAALQQCSTEHFKAEAALNFNEDTAQDTVQERMKSTLWSLLTNVLTRSDVVYEYEVDDFSWSLEGYSMVARIAKSILSSWCIDKTCFDDKNAWGDTVFMAAARMGHTSVVELLLADPRVDKASIDHASQFGRTALMQAASSGHVSIVELLLADPRVDKGSIDHVDQFGRTALMQIACSGHVSIAELLLADPCVDKGSIDHADATGTVALMLAARHGHTSIMEVLLADPRVDKASIDRSSQYGKTALMYAARFGHTPIIELLLADPRMCQSYINRTTTSGNTALRFAVRKGRLRVVHLLINDSRTSWDSIVELADDRRIMKRNEILPLIIAELTRRQMCVIYPSTNRLIWPVYTQSDAECGDTKSSGPAESDIRDDSDESDVEERECALITSFFKSDLFDVNVLRIIREYTTYTV